MVGGQHDERFVGDARVGKHLVHGFQRVFQLLLTGDIGAGRRGIGQSFGDGLVFDRHVVGGEIVVHVSAEREVVGVERRDASAFVRGQQVGQGLLDHGDVRGRPVVHLFHAAEDRLEVVAHVGVGLVAAVVVAEVVVYRVGLCAESAVLVAERVGQPVFLGGGKAVEVVEVLPAAAEQRGVGQEAEAEGVLAV